MKFLGIVLIAICLLMLVYRGFTFTQEKNVAGIGPIEINKKEQHSIGWQLYAGGIAMFAGVLLLMNV